jgi:hypothetical protein
MTAAATTRTAEPGVAPSRATQSGIVAAWVALAVGLPALVVALSPLSTVDLAYGIRTGEQVLGEAGIPRVDAFTFTAAGLPWVDQQWLAHVIFAALYGLGGWAALQVLWVGVVAATVGLTARAAFVAGAGLRTSVMVALAGFVVAAQGLGLRAQVLGLLCLAVSLVLVAGRRDHPGLPWLAVPLLAAWANLHGSFVVGLALLAVTAVADRRDRSARRRDLVVLVAAAVATLANPYGVDAWRYVVSIGTDPTISAFVTEWRHTDPLQAAGAVFYASIVAAAVVAALAARRGGPPDVGSLLWLGILAGLGAWALRAVAWWGIGAVPGVAVAASRVAGAATDRSGLLAVPGEVSRRRVAAGVAAALAVLVAVGIALAQPAVRRLTDAPSGMADAVRSIAFSHPGLRVFDAERWGSWLELEVPDASYFADSRIELIPASAWLDYVAVSEAQPDWQAILDRWQVDALVLSSGDQPSLVATIEGSTAWRVVHRDADGLVAVRA